MSEPTLTCLDLSVRHEHDGPPTLSGLSFSVDPGERVALVGLNGTGKTSLLMSLVGLVHHEGEIRIGGTRLTPTDTAAVRKRVGFLFNVPEDQLLFSKVVEDVAFGPLQSGETTDGSLARAREILEKLGIGRLAEEPIHHLSHGQKQRVALAGAIVTRPPLLLLDEPTAGMDPPARRELATILEGLSAAQLIATHDLDFADRVCTKVIFLQDGGVSDFFETTEEVRRRWGMPPAFRGDQTEEDR